MILVACVILSMGVGSLLWRRNLFGMITFICLTQTALTALALALPKGDEAAQQALSYIWFVNLGVLGSLFVVYIMSARWFSMKLNTRWQAMRRLRF